MNVPGLPELLLESERVLRTAGRAGLCQIVRAEGSTPGKPGWKMLIRPDGTAFGNLGGGAFEALVQADARALLEQKRPVPEIKRYYLTETAVRGEPTGMVCGGLVDVLLEVLLANPLLVICGGGPVGQAVAHAAALCDFDLLVVEDREEFRRRELFPDRTSLAEVGRDFSEPFLEPFGGREILAAVLTRCWETDLAALASILRQTPEHLAYLGLMGSRRKIERVRSCIEDQDLDLEGLPFHAPIGLPIGGDQPAEIAVSILAEIIQVRAAMQQKQLEPQLEYARQ